METVVIQREDGAVARGRRRSPAADVARRYGEGDAGVDALRGVSLDIDARAADRGDGALRLRQVDADAHPRRSRPADPRHGHDRRHRTITELSDTQLTKLRREHIGFIFQFFNLLPMLTAEENVLLPLEIAGKKPDQAWVDELTEQGRALRSGSRTDPRSSPAGSSSASRSRARSSRGRR